MGPIGKEMSVKENTKPVPSIKTFMNVFKPIREWLHQTTRQPKTSTPIGASIIRSSSDNGCLRRSTNNAIHSMNKTNSNNVNNSNNNSYGGDSLTGSSGDMLSTANPTPTHHQQQHHHHHNHNTLQNRYAPIQNGTLGDRVGGCGMLNSSEDHLNESTRLGGANEASGMGSTMEINQQFSRSAQARMSLPILQQNKLRRQAYSQLQRRGQLPPTRSMGHIYLQHKGETKQASLPNELTTVDTIRALFVCAFPHLLTMEYMSQPHVKIYIYNPSCNIFYELCDIEDVRHESVLRIHHSDPLGTMALASSAASMAPLGAMPIGMIAHHPHNPYSTLHRIPSRIPPQMMPTIPQQQQHQHQQQQQNQAEHHRRQVQPSPLQQAPSVIGPVAMMAHPMMQQQHQMMKPQHPLLHHPMQGPPVPQLSQIPPPKPRRMIPASYSMHRLQAHQSQ